MFGYDPVPVWCVWFGVGGDVGEVLGERGGECEAAWVGGGGVADAAGLYGANGVDEVGEVVGGLIGWACPQVVDGSVV